MLALDEQAVNTIHEQTMSDSKINGTNIEQSE
jgi:hypothetical protein